ncbi:MAG: hypothetical protein IPK87_04375 [Planctomycetes bacterium]|nr:hypothetical protein [Planctomycetota bacterium]
MSNLDQYSRRSPEPGAVSSPAERGVPLSVYAVSLFGGFANLFGSIWLSISMVAVWVFVPMTDVSSLWRFSGEMVQASGRVIAIESTGYSEGGTDDTPGTPVFAVRYQFTDSRGVVHQGMSYTLGAMYAPDGPVSVEYRADDPKTSRIVGARTSPAPIWVLLIIMIFPTIGVVFLFFGLREGIRRTSLLGSGKLARGKLVSKSPTNTSINNQRVYKFEYEFEAEDGSRHISVARTHETNRLQDEETEQILYHPRNPSRSYVVDALPAGVTIGPEGRFRAPHPVRTLGILLPPLILLAVNAFGLAAWLG